MDKLVELVSYLQNDELQYFDRFYELTKKQVFYMIYSILRDEDDSEDILQDTYIKFLKYKKKVKLDGNIMSYLLQIAKTLSLNYLKKRMDKIESVDAISDNITKTSCLDNCEINLIMKKVLKPLEYQIVILHVVNEMTHKEIAELLDKPLGTVTWSYNNAIQKIRRKLEK